MHDTPPASVLIFLEGLGLAQYAAEFEAQLIDLALLPALSDAQLQELGVAAMGHRIKLLRAAAALLAPPPAAPTAAAAVAPAEATSSPAAERRQITVMFCDLVGSTALSQRLDPEDLRALMQRYQQTCGEVVARHQGTVAQYLGDGLMVYFGWPRANEDDARRAVACGLQLVEAVKTITAAEPLQVRVGVATGAVVVATGDGDGDASQPRMAVGQTPNLAARVQAQAQPDEVLVAASTRRLLRDSFVCDDLGEHALKGFATPVRLWRALREGRSATRFAAAHGAGLTPMVNRDLEISLLMERWVRAGDGRGQAVLLLGEPGIGKSRVLAELCQRVPKGRLRLRLQCSALHLNSSFYPFMTNFLRVCGVERSDGPEARLDKLDALLTRLGPVALRQARHFAALLSLPLTRFAPNQSSPAKTKLETIEAFVQVLRDIARDEPVLLLAEDLHWADPSSLEVLDALITALRDLPVLLVMTSRTPLGERWAMQPQVTTLSLVGLNRSHSLQLASAVAAAHGLPQRILERIVSHTDGVPLFLEELTRTLADGLTRAPGTDANTIEIPATLKDSLTARLDQLGPARRALQLGSLLGRQFRHDGLLALHGGGDAAVTAQLEGAIGAGLLSRSGIGSDASYTFQHALIQDAAYESMLKSDRRALHARAGDLLSHQAIGLVNTEPELLARHYTAGEAWDQAVPLWLKAGQLAWARAAAQEAIAHLNAGIALVERISQPAQRDALELGLQSTLGVVHFAALSYAAPQAQAAFERAQALCERIPDAAMKAPVLYGLGAFQTMKGDARAGHLTFERMRVEADAAVQPRLQFAAQAVLAWSHANLGQHTQAIAAAEQVRRLVQAGALAGVRLGAADPRMFSECFAAMSLWALGHADQARAASDAVLALARTLDPYSLAYALTFGAIVVPELCGDDATVIARADEGIALCRNLGYPFLESSGLIRRSWALGRSGDAATVATALAALDQAISRNDSLGVGYLRGQYLAWRARLLLRMGDKGAAQLAVTQALGQIENSGNLIAAADVLLTEAEVLLAHGGERRARANAALQTACDLARGQGARAWTLRATLALARLCAEDDSPAAARDLLTPVLADLSEGHDTPDLQDARQLLAAWA